MTKAPDQLLPASTWWELLEMDLIPMFLARKAVADSLGTSQRKSFHISFTLHIYYIIFFYKNQISTFALDFYFVKTEFDIRCSIQLSYTPHIRDPKAPLVVHLRHLARWWEGWQDSNLRPAAPQARHNCCYRLLMEKVVWRKKISRASLFPYLT